MLEHALSLAAQGFYVFPIAEGQKAPPIVNWQKRASRDEEQIRKWWDGKNHNIGISTSRYGDSEALLVVDIDTKGKHDGFKTLLGYELANGDLPPTFTQLTPTGGRHLFYRVPQPVKQGANVLGPGVDVRSRGGYVVGAGSAVATGVYRAGDETGIAAAPGHLVERCGVGGEVRRERERTSAESVDVASSEARAVHYLKHEAPLSIEGEGGDETAYKVACRLKDLGVSRQDALGLMLDHWNDRCSPPWGRELSAKVANAYAYGTEPPGVAAPEAVFEAVTPADAKGACHPFDAINKEFAFAITGGSGHLLWETKDAAEQPVLQHMDIATFHRKFASKTMVVGKKAEPITELWMKSEKRRSYDGICFYPGLQAPERFYNLWRGYSYEPAPAGSTHPSVDAFVEHARDNVCDADPGLFRWLMGYFAHLVQRPWEKPLVSLVFRGGKGVGKNALVERVGSLVRSNFLVSSSKRYLTSPFNGHLENLLLFCLDEAFWSGDKQAEGILKDLITGTHHVIERKGQEPYRVENRTRIVIVGNEDWLVPATSDERRFAVYDVGDGRKQDRAYFQHMREGMEAGGYAVLLRYLLDFDLTGIDLNDAPRTQALIDQKHESLDIQGQWWLDCLTEGRIVQSDFEGTFGGTVECERLRDAAGRYAKARGVRRWGPAAHSFGRLLHKLCPAVKPTKARIAGKPTNVYVLPALDAARAQWCTHVGGEVKW